jgi:tetratricopeptide (TPR) repeat protein
MKSWLTLVARSQRNCNSDAHGRDRRGCPILNIMRSFCFLFFALGMQTAAGQSSNSTPAPSVEALLSAGIAAQQRHDYKTAIEDYGKVLAVAPKEGEARANLGAALAAVGQFDAAIDEDTRALDTAPDKTAVRLNLALAYYKKGDMDHAHTEFELVHAARPADVKTAVLLGYTDIKLNKDADAAQMLAPLEPGHESDMDFEYVLGLAMIGSGKDTEGLPRMETVARATRSVDAYFIAGSARMHRIEFREARADLDAALEINPSFPGLYTLAGQARDALGDTDASVPVFEAALREDPRDATANLYLGVTRLKQRDFAGARPLLELALELRPGHSPTRLQLAKLDSMTGKYAEAAATLEDLEKNDPAWLDPHVELATIYYKLHRPADGDREREIVRQIEAKQQQAGPPKD